MGADDRDARDELLRLLLAEEGLAAAPEASIGQRPVGAPPVLSYAQERMWFLTRLEPDASALNMRVAARVRGPLDLDVLRRAVDALVERHEVLRTTVADRHGEPLPTILDAVAVPFEVRAVTDEAHLAGELSRDGARPFRLDHEIPIRVTVYQLGDLDHVVALVLHHIAADGWSLQVLGEELDALYGAFASGRPSPLAPLPIQYADYAAWQRSAPTQERIDRQLAYWTSKLAPPLPVFEIPTDHPRSREHRSAGALVERQVDDHTASGLRRLAASTRATLFMVMLTAFEVVAARRADQDDVVVGIPVAGRVRPELEPLVGAFLNNLVLRTDLGGDPTFAEALDRVRTTSLEAFDHQDVPFERLLAELNPPRDRSRTPLFQVFFNLQDVDRSTQRASLMAHLAAEPVPDPEPDAKFDLTMYVLVDRERIALRCVYDADLYEPATIEELVDQYLVVLADVAADPTRRISASSLVTARARSVLPELSAPLDATWHGSVPDAVRSRADANPDAPAIVDRGREVRYGTLAAGMDRIAAWLAERGVGTGAGAGAGSGASAGDVVAILGQRSGALVLSALGALAARCAYTVLDPRYPPARLAQYVRIARPAALLWLEEAGPVPPEVEAALDAVGTRHRLLLPADVQRAADADGPVRVDGDGVAGGAPAGSIGPDDPACLTFTSGSTGEPKAVLGRHGSLTHFFPWMTEHFDVSASDRFSMLSGLSHDPLQRDMFWPLWIGATIVVPDGDRLLDPGWLAGWLHDQAVTVAHLTPAMGQLVAEVTAGPRHRLPLRRAFFIGDVLNRLDVSRLRALAPDVVVVNLYGTTETQRASGFHVVTAGELDDPGGSSILPIGRAMPGTQLSVRSASGALAGIGEVGDIWFRSPHLALGYVGDPDETARRFVIDDPALPSVRSYRTGDRGRFRADGEIEYMGRADDQVQVRGFRVEPGEVAAAVRACPGVVNAAVVCRHHPAAGAELVAYAVLDGSAVDVGEVRRAVAERLPGHMVPARVVAVPTIPMTPNGKVDRRALPDPDEVPAVATAATEPAARPRDDLERTIAAIWAKVLGRDVGVHDDFFDLGGYSLLGTRVFAMIEQQTGHRLPVSVLFEHRTVARLAQAIRDDGWRRDWTSMVPIQPAGERRPLFYVAPYMIGVLELAPLGDELGDDQPLYGFQPQGLDGALPPHVTIEQMAAHYIAEMRSVQPEGPYAIGGHCAGSWVAYEMARQLDVQGEEVDALVLVDLGPPGIPRPQINPLVYLANHVGHYLRSGRLHHAIAWKLKVFTARYLLRRVGSPTARFESSVREVHRGAFKVYRGGRTRLPLTLVLSDDSMTLNDATWYGRWAELTSGGVTTHRVGGTHANLLVRPYVQRLGRVIVQTLRSTDAARSVQREVDGSPATAEG